MSLVLVLVAVLVLVLTHFLPVDTGGVTSYPSVEVGMDGDRQKKSDDETDTEQPTAEA